MGGPAGHVCGAPNTATPPPPPEPLTEPDPIAYEDDLEGPIAVAGNPYFWSSTLVWGNREPREIVRDEDSQWKSITDPYDPRWLLGRAGDPGYYWEGQGTLEVHGDSTRFWILGEWQNHYMLLDVIPNETLESVSLKLRSNHHFQCGFGGYGFGFDVGEGIEYDGGKKEPRHGIYSRSTGTAVGTYDFPVNEPTRLLASIQNIDDAGHVLVRGWINHTMSRDPADFQFIGWYIDDGNMPFSEDSFGDAEKEQDIRECIGRGDLTMGTDPDTDDYVEQARQAGIPPFVRGTNGAWVRMNEVENAPNGRAEAISVSYLELAEIEPLATQLTEQELACPPVLR